jgi:ABC-type microcin C transport system duplicated ATPase subunit YejF
MLIHTEFIVLDESSSCWMSSRAEECLFLFEDLRRDAVLVSLSLVEDLKVRRRLKVVPEFGNKFLLAETGHSQDSDWTYT